MTPVPTNQQKEAIDVTHNVCVKASAGTGKTFILKERYLRHLKENRISPEKILCLTFTDKAAAEMRDRIEKELRKQAAETHDPDFEKALEKIHRCSISTFHGFCSQVLSEFPLEAGIPVGWRVMDDLDRQNLVSDTIDDLLQTPDAKLRETVVFCCIHLPLLKKAVEKLLDFWKDEDCRSWFDLLRTNQAAVFQKWEGDAKSAFEETVHAYAGNEGIKRLLCAFAETLDLTEKQDRIYKALLTLTNAETPVEQKRTALESLKGVNISYPDAVKKDDEVKEAYSSLKDDLREALHNYDIICRPEAKEFMRHVLLALSDIVMEADRRICDKKTANGFLSYDDLIEKTRILMSNPAVLNTLRRRYPFILVDEVQDNDPALTEIIKALSGSPDKNHRLFIVGDIKQSIYGFKGARPDEISEFAKEFEKDISLSMNYRTVEPVQKIINQVFTPLFKDSDKITYTDVDAFRKETFGTVTLLENKIDKENSKENHESEALKIAAWIKETMNDESFFVSTGEKPKEGETDHSKYLRRPAYKDYAILVQRRKHNDALRRALRAYHIPFTEFKGQSFYQEQEIYDIMHVLKACVFDDDDIALYGALVSPYFGVSDEALCIAGSKNTKIPLRKRLEASDILEIRTALDLLHEFETDAVTLPLYAFIEKILQKTGILSIYASLENGSDRIANLEKLAAMAKEKNLAAGQTIFEFIKTVDTCIDEDIKEEENGTEEDAEDRVKIMTIHASKGLEFPVVILAFAGERYNAGKHSGVMFMKDYGAVCTSLTLPGGEDKLFAAQTKLIKKCVRDRELEEKQRLFYVALTRAKDHLAVSASCKENPADTSFMNWFKPAVSSVVKCDTNSLCEPQTADFEEYKAPDWWQSVPVPFVSCGPQETARKEPAIDRRYLLEGSCVHEIFEGANSKQTCLKYGMPEKEAEFKEKYDRFRKSELMRDAAAEWHELPLRDAEGKRKVVDLLLKKADGSYLIVDFKSGTKKAKSKELIEEYKKQLTCYAETLCAVLGRDKIPAVLYFIGDEEILPVAEIK